MLFPVFQKYKDLEFFDKISNTTEFKKKMV